MKPGKFLMVTALGWQAMTVAWAANQPSAAATTPARVSAAATDANAAHPELTGLVRDSRNDLPLFEAKVTLGGSGEVLLTDAAGAFVLSKKPVAGKLTVSKDGYKDTTLNLDAKTPANLIVKLQPAPSELDGDVYTLGSFEVVADLVEGSPARMLELKFNSTTTFSALSSADFSRMALPDAAAAIQRITGVSVQEGKYAVIRGLGDRYTSTTLNGVMIPSPDPDRQAVQLDLFPSGVLDNIKAIKTFVPDQPGTSSGGSIQLETKGVPDERILKLEISTSFNTNATGNHRFLQTESRSGDAWAHGVADRPIPSGLEPGRKLALTRGAPDPNLGLKATYGDSYQTKGWGRIGVISNINYSVSSTSVEDGIYNRFVSNNLPGQLTPANVFASQDVSGYRRQTFEKSETEHNLGGLVGIAWQPSDEHTLKYNRLHLRSALNQGYRQTGPVYYDNLGYVAPGIAERLSYNERVLDLHQFNGDHQFYNDRLNVSWNYTHADSSQTEPDLRQTAAIDEGGGNINVNGGSSFLEIPYRSWRDINEVMDAGRADLSYKAITRPGWDNTVSTGYSLSDSKRDYKEQTFQLRYEGASFITKQEDFNKLNPLSPPITTGEIHATKENRAYYGQVEQRLFTKFRIIGGGRVESNDIKANVDQRLNRIAGSNAIPIPDLNDPGRFIKVNFEQEDLLPSLTAIYDINPEMNIRAAWSRTVALPSYREISPYFNRTLIGGDIEVGNTNLKSSGVTNYDLGWQWNRPNGDTYSFSLFYKEIDNAIEKIQGYEIPGSGLVQTTLDSGTLYSWYNNPTTVTLAGFEAEFRKNLGFVSERLSDFHVGSGVTFIESVADLQPFEAAAKTQALGHDPKATRPLVGQPGLILNAELGYNNPDQKLEATLLYYVIGDKLSAAGLKQSFDVYELSYQTMDFVVSKGIGERWKVRLAAKNLTDSRREKAYFMDNREINSLPVRDSYRVGRTFSVSVSCDF